MTLVSSFLLFYLGCCLASFLTLVGMRVPRKESIVAPPSHCDSCQHRLSAKELLPIFSFLFQKGKCRHCGTPLSIAYLTMEVVAGVSFLVIVTAFSGNMQTGSLVFLLWIFGIVFTISDIHYFLLPDSIMRIFLFLSLLLRLVWDPFSFFPYLLSGSTFFVLLFVLFSLYPDGLGGGDVKLFGVIGLLLGFQRTIWATFLSSLFGLIFGLIKKHTQSRQPTAHLPFGPFIFLGAILSVLMDMPS